VPVRTTRRRGGVWYAGGTVRVGKAVVAVPEYSTGAVDRSAADHIAATRDAEIRREILEGPAGRARSLTMAEAFAAYVDRPGGVAGYDLARVLEFNEAMGGRPIAEAVPAWGDWLRSRGAHLKPATVARSRATLQAALNHGAEALDIPAPRLPGVRCSGQARGGGDGGRVSGHLVRVEHCSHRGVAGGGYKPIVESRETVGCVCATEGRWAEFPRHTGRRPRRAGESREGGCEWRRLTYRV